EDPDEDAAFASEDPDLSTKRHTQIKLPKNPSVPLQSIKLVEERHNAPGFTHALLQHIYTLKLGRRLTPTELQTTSSNLPFNRVDVFHGFKFAPQPLTDDKNETDVVKARPACAKQPARFDTAVILQESDAETTGLQGAQGTLFAWHIAGGSPVFASSAGLGAAIFVRRVGWGRAAAKCTEGSHLLADVEMYIAERFVVL
ncbi:hypothetical protein EVJ58_g10981, partial [Rhodofomes roseus]